MAFTARPTLNPAPTCSAPYFAWPRQGRSSRDHFGGDLGKNQKNRGHHKIESNDLNHRSVASSARAAQSDDQLRDVHVLHWIGELLTNLGWMAVRLGHTVTIRATGFYLISMRPDPKLNTSVNLAVVKNGATDLWRVYTEGTPAADMAVFRFTLNTILQYVIFQTNPCHFQDGSYISIALCRSDWKG